MLLRMGASLEKDPVRKKRMLDDIDAVNNEHLVEMFTMIRSLTWENRLLLMTTSGYIAD